MRSGTLRETLIFEVKDKSRNGFGDQIEDWVTLFEAQGQYQPVGSLIFPEAWKRFQDSTARFLIRYPFPVAVILDPALHRIRLVRDFTSPAESTIFEINPTYPVAGKPFLVFIEGKETK